MGNAGSNLARNINLSTDMKSTEPVKRHGDGKNIYFTDLTFSHKTFEFTWETFVFVMEIIWDGLVIEHKCSASKCRCSAKTKVIVGTQ